MKKLLLLLLVGCLNTLTPPLLFSQTLYNKKNVDRTAMSFFDGMKTFRALEYTVAPDPQSEKVYRLQMEPENGFPAIVLKGREKGVNIYFEDKSPYNNQFSDNPTQYLSSEAVQLLYGFEAAMKAYDQRFGWKGSDGLGTVPVEIRMENSKETGNPNDFYSGYGANAQGGFFAFGRNLDTNLPFLNSIDVVAHELCHSIIRYKTGIYYSIDSLPIPYMQVNEGISDIFGIYIKNKLAGNSLQNYDWVLAPQIIAPPMNIANPKSYNAADTYNGQYFVTTGPKPIAKDAGAGVAAKWFYLLVNGFKGSATNDLNYTYTNLNGIAVEKAIQIVWDAIPSLKLYSGYPAFKLFTLTAAEQLYGLNSPEYLAVGKAWDAVGVSDNNLPYFSMHPQNGVDNVDPWPGLKVNFKWDDKPIGEWEIQMSTKYDFSENLQTYKVSNFDTFFKPGGGVVYIGTVKGYYRRDEQVYVRAKITQAGANFCKGLNPLCPLYQQFSPTHSFKLSNKQAQFWHAVQTAGFIVNAWDNPAIEWKSVSNAEKYTFQIATDKAFANFVYTGTVNHSGNFSESGIINTNLEINKKYYTRVRAERNNSAQLSDNFGVWSTLDSVTTHIPPTSIIQALNQQPNDPPATVSSLGFAIDYYKTPGAVQNLVQVATDDAFASIVRSQVVPGNLTNALITLPNLPDGTNLYVRVLPQKGVVYSTCTNVWRIKTDKHAVLLAMAGPDVKVPIPYKTYLGKIFKWALNTVDIGLVDHFEVHIKEKSSDLTTIFQTPGKALEREVLDQLMYDDHQGIEVRVLAVGPQGAKSGLSSPFVYTICPDQPFPKFPTDMDKVDPSKAFTMTWDPSLWFESGDQYLVTLASNGIPINGFNDAPTTTPSMVVPAGTLGNGKNYTLTIKNSASCPGVNALTVLFSTIAGGNNIPPDPPKKDLDIKLQAFRSDLDLADPLPFENSDYVLEVELLDPNGDKMEIVDGNGNLLSQLLVDSENSILGLNAANVPTGKYTLKIKMFNIFDPVLYSVADQPRFSVVLNGNTVIDNHVITIYPFDVNSAYNEWKVDFQFSDVILNHQ